MCVHMPKARVIFGAPFTEELPVTYVMLIILQAVPVQG